MNPEASGIVVTLFLTGAVAAADVATPLETSADALERAYLECERRARAHLLSTAEIARCSIIYEELKQRVFDGDWKKMREWTDDNLVPLHGS